MSMYDKGKRVTKPRTAGQQAALAAMLAARHTPKKEEKMIDTNNIDTSSEQAYDASRHGFNQFEIQREINFKAKAAALAFNEELVTVQILDTDNPNAEQVVNLGINGVNQFIFRGHEQTIKRKFLEQLSRAKTENISTPEYTDAQGNRATKIVKSQGLKYPFRVVKDDNPLGARWLEGILKQAT